VKDYICIVMYRGRVDTITITTDDDEPGLLEMLDGMFPDGVVSVKCGDKVVL
jgi:hypothetical protein